MQLHENPNAEGAQPKSPRPSFSQEEAIELQEWAKKKGRAGNERLSDIKRARTIGRIARGVGVGIIALGLVVGGIEKDDIAARWKQGFNEKPRGPYPGITLANPDAQRRLQCLSDRFHDESGLFPNIGGNKWAGENCKDVDANLDSMGFRYSNDPLTAIANLKNQELRRAGLQSDNPSEHAVVEWRDQPLLGMSVYADEDRLAEIAEAQKATTGTVNFIVE